jgi:magnesium-transporting ATPase (P-type)
MSYGRAALANIEDLFKEYQTGPEGLSDEEVRRRLRETGLNVIPKSKKVSLSRKILLQFSNMFNLLLLIASFLSFLSGFTFNDPTSFQMGFAIIVVIVLSMIFSLFQEYRAEKAVQVIKKLIPTKTKAIRNGVMKEADVTETVPGDIIALEEGDRVPADLRLFSAFEVSVDNSILTGESEPQRRFATMPPEMETGNPYDAHNLLFAGTTLVSGVARGVVLTTAANTEFGRIVSLSGEIHEPMSSLEKDIDHTAKLNFLLAIGVSLIFFSAALLVVRLNLATSILFAIGVMICLVPEGFQLTVSLSLALTARKMAERNVVVKRLSSVETAGSMTVLCVDKTGTITSGEMMVKRLWAAGKIFEITGDGYSPDGQITFNGGKIDRAENLIVSKLLEVGAFCNNAKLNAPSDRIGRWTILGDPTDGAFLVFAGKGDFNVSKALAENQRISLIPFDSKRRMMTSVQRDSEGRITAYTKGAGSEVLKRCTTIYYGTTPHHLTDEDKNAIKRQMNDFAAEGFRVLAMATRTLPSMPENLSQDVEENMSFLGLAALLDPPRPNVEAAVQEAKRAGISVVMLTGDHELTAYSIGKKVGIITSDEQKVFTGKELTQMTDAELTENFAKGECVFARITPEEKLRIVHVLKSIGEVVAVTGDGVNDSPALMEANVGIAMGAGGTDVARESADMVLLDNDFTSIVEGVRLGRSTFDNLRKFVSYVYTHNWAELVAFVVFVLLQTPLPLLVIQVLAIDLGMDVLPSLALIMEPPEPDAMLKPPRKAGTKLINISTLLRGLYLGVIASIGAIYLASSVWGSGGWVLGQSTVSDAALYARGTTIVMTGIMMGQVGNLFSTRTSSLSAFRLSPSRNPWIARGILVLFVVLAAIVYVPFLQPIFGTAPLLPSDFFFLLLLIPTVLLVEELRKVLARKLQYSKTKNGNANSIKS